MSERRVRQNELFPLNLGGERYMVAACYDRVDYFDWLGEAGHWILKIYDDEEGIVDFHISDPESALKLKTEAHLPFVERDFIYQKEYDGYLRAMGTQLEEIYGDELNDTE